MKNVFSIFLLVFAVSLTSPAIGQPRGLPDRETIALLRCAADAVLRKGHNQKVGCTMDLHALAQTIRFIKHRTAAPTGRMMAFRQISSDLL